MLKRIALLAMVASCSTPTEPLHVSGLPQSVAMAVIGTWNLASWNADPVPSKYETHFKQVFSACPPPNEHLIECFPTRFVQDYVVSIESSAVTLNDNATFTRTVTMVTEYTDGSPPTRVTETVNGSYSGSVAGGAVSLSLYATGAGQLLLGGTISANTFTAKLGVAGGASFTDVWLYQK